jgi:outer membrane receptor protein involved in Fe transport
MFGSKRIRHQQSVFLKHIGTRRVSFYFFFLICSCICAFGQFDTAAINGTIRDSTGAVIVAAAVDIENRDTGLKRTTATNSSGTYNLTEIPPGSYRIAVSADGFQTSVRESIILTVSQRSVVDFALALGASSQTVDVQASAVELETSSADLGASIPTNMVNGLPLNGRNYTGLLTLQSGVSPVNNAQTGFRVNPIGNAVFPSIQGQNTRSNTYLLDGVNNNEAITGEQTITPIPDDIQEVKLLAHSDYAQFGGSVGGVINVVTKSGTNKFHGGAWEYLRNSELFDAKNTLTGNLSPLHQNQFGANFGGPVLLPFYNGRNRTFFFGSYEGFRLSSASQTLLLVPTSNQLAGDFSGVLAQGVQLYDPHSPTRAPFVGNQIAAALDPNMVKLAQTIFPAPSYNAVAGFNAIDTTPFTQHSDQYDLRLDEYINQNNQVWAHYLHQHNPTSGSAGFPGLLSVAGESGFNLGVAWVHTFSPNTVMTVSFGRNSSTLSPEYIYTKGNVTDIVNAAGFSSSFACGFQHSFRDCMLPYISIASYVSGGEGNSAPNDSSDVWEGKADVSKSFGRHTFYAGFNIDTNNQGKTATAGSNLGFTSFESSNGSSGGDALASFLMSVPNNVSRSDQLQLESGGFVNGFYGQDQWKIRDNLTLNIGLRYDVTAIPTISSTPFGSFFGITDFNTGTYILQNLPPACSATQFAPCIPGGTLPANVVVSKNGKLFQTDRTNIQPRLGLTYSLKASIVLRGSYGRVYDNWAAVDQYAQNVQSWPMLNTVSAQNLNTGVATVSAENPLAGFNGQYPSATPFTQVGYNGGPQYRAPYSDQWNVGIQQGFFRDTVWTLNYVGSRGGKLDYTPVANTAITPGPGDPSLRSPYPNISPSFFDRPIGKLSYNALQTSLQGKNALLGLTYLISYTWSKAMDYGADGWFGAEGESIEDPYDFNRDHSVTGMDLTNVFTAGWTWELPVGRNHLSTGNRVGDYIVGNWALNGILTLESGTPFNVYDTGDIANTGNFNSYERPNLVSNPIPQHQSQAQWLNPSAFQTPAQYTFGNLGRNAFRTDAYKNIDLSLYREFSIYDSSKLQFRGDAFNAFNHPVWGTPNACQNCTNFGEVGGTRSTPRQLQVSIKFVF